MKIFVAGARGALGRLLVPQLVARGHSVTGMTNSAELEELRESAFAIAYRMLGRVSEAEDVVLHGGGGGVIPSLSAADRFRAS